MKKIFLIALLFGAVFTMCAQDVVYKSTPTLEWDHDEFGNDNFSWDIYAFDYTLGVADDQDTTGMVFVGNYLASGVVLSFPYASDWAVGVRTVFVDDDDIVVNSAIAWSYDAAVAVNPFIYTPSYSPSPPLGLRDSGM